MLTLLGGTLILSGCSVTPVPEGRKTIAYSENAETGGIEGFLDNGSVHVDGDARTRYNSYVQKYGKNLLPPISSDYGVEALGDGTYSLTDEAFEKWVEMIQMDHRERINNAK